MFRRRTNANLQLFLSRLVSPYLTQKSVRLITIIIQIYFCFLISTQDLSSFSYRTKRYRELGDARAFEQLVVRSSSSSSPALVTPEQKTTTRFEKIPHFFISWRGKINPMCNKKERAHETVSRQKASSHERFSPIAQSLLFCLRVERGLDAFFLFFWVRARVFVVILFFLLNIPFFSQKPKRSQFRVLDPKMASGPLKKRFRSILRRTLFHPTNWENHVETRKKRKRTSKTRTRARPRRRRRRCRFRTKETRRHSMPRLDFVFFGRKGAFSLGRLRHTRMKRMHDVTTVRSLICFTKKKKEKMRMQSRARERTRDPRRRETRTRTRTSHFFPRDGNKRKSEITASETLR